MPVAEREMVMVHVDDGTDRGQDFKFEKKDADRYLAGNPNARIVGADEIEAAKQAQQADADEPEAKAVEKAPANKSQAKAESK